MAMTASEDTRTASERLRASLSEGIGNDLGVTVRVRDLLEVLGEHERLTAPPTDDEREALGEAALRAYLAPTEPRPWTRLSKWEREKWIAAGSVGFRRQGPITGGMVRAAAKAMYDIEAKPSMSGASSLAQAALEAARDAS